MPITAIAGIGLSVMRALVFGALASFACLAGRARPDIPLSENEQRGAPGRRALLLHRLAVLSSSFFRTPRRRDGLFLSGAIPSCK